MSLDAAALRKPQVAKETAQDALASDPAASIIRHAVKIWAFDQGLSPDEVARLTERVVAFTCAEILSSQRKAQAVA